MASLLRGFAASVQAHPDRTALVIDGRRFSYAELADHGRQLADAIARRSLSTKGLVGLLAAEERTAYTGAIAILGAGRTVVPIDPNDPPARIHDIVRNTRIDTVVVGPSALDRLEPLVGSMERPLSIIAPDVDRLRGLAARHPRHRYTTGVDLDADAGPLLVDDVSPQKVAYLLYTSGTTTSPRGVPVTHGRAMRYLEAAQRRVPLRGHERCSHTFAPTFDLSIHDLFATWSAGATLVAWPASRGVDPARLIESERLTRWFCVPTTAMAMARMGELTPGRFSSLRTTLFCGEALPESVARAWARAAPHGAIYNLYGPAEATIAVTAHRLRGDASDCRRDTVCLGRPFDGHRARVVDDDGGLAAPHQTGELWLSGPQVCDGYVGAPEATDEHFVDDEEGRRWFRTGDLVERDGNGRLYFRGRTDHRIKLRGHHVDLNEVDRALRLAGGHPMACAVAWPADAHQVRGLVGFVACDDDDPVDEHDLLAQCRRILPRAIVPDRIISLSHLPTNGSGKLDRRAMQRLLRHREV